MEEVILPEEILTLICQELGTQRDFHSLYNCARSAKSLADAALRTIYKYHDISPAFVQSDDAEIRQRGDTFGERAAHQKQFFRRWTVLWRSIITSSVDGSKTYKPYCRYLRVLDLRNLGYMLEDFNSKWADQHIKRAFFAAPLQRFNHSKEEYNRKIIDIPPTVNHVGEAVVPRAAFLEELTGNLQPGYLAGWVSQVPRLSNMDLWEGSALNEGVGSAISEYCEHFKSLTILTYLSEDADEVFSKFLNELKKDSLQHFQMIGRNKLGKLTFDALGRHQSLKELKLGSLNREAMEHLNSLKDCTQIELLSLEDYTGSTQLEALNNDVFLDVVYWLSSCTKLVDITLKNFYDGPSILAQVAVNPEVRWTKLFLESTQNTGYSIRNPNAAAFHTSLSEQTSLESLWLKGSGEDSTPDDLSILVSSISSLNNLKELVLREISDEFEDTHIISLAYSLPFLEEFWTSGGEVSADVLPALANLQCLKNLTFYALTQFSLDDILDFLGKLDTQTQQGFTLSLMAVDQAYILSDEEQELIRDYMRINLNGRLDFVPWRDDDTSSDEDD